MHQVTLIPGEGIGPEVTGAARRVLEATGVKIEWEVVEASLDTVEKYGTALPDYVLDSIARTKVALKGPVATPMGKGFNVPVSWTEEGKRPSTTRIYPSITVGLRKEFDLYANLRPARIYPGIKSRFENVDLIVVRENTEDLYMSIEHMVTDDIAEAVKIITRRASERVIRFTFDYAAKNGRKMVTALHKSNILKLTDGLFLETAQRVAQDYPQIEFNDRIIDNICMQLVQKPEQYDMLVAPNLYGDIISDLCAGLVGGLGVAPAANVGPDVVMFEAVHGSAPKYAGLNRANPMATILCGIMMLRHLNEKDAADRAEKALLAVLEEGKNVTVDLGGNAGTIEFTNAIIDAMQRA